jgi:DNA-binding NarL/FixJ family response regulator
MRANAVTMALRAYHVAVAENWAEVLRMARRATHDLYVIVSPLGWISSREACRRFRRFDPHTPMIVYAMHGTAAERREVMAAGAQAYIARYEELRNVSGIAAQLIMLTELRSMEALRSAGQRIRENLLSRLSRARAPGEAPALRRGSQALLKVEARRLFAQAGGSRANFERLWPSIYEDLVERLTRPGGGARTPTPPARL